MCYYKQFKNTKLAKKQVFSNNSKKKQAPEQFCPRACYGVEYGVRTHDLRNHNPTL